MWPPQGAERAPEVAVKAMPEKLEPGNPAMVVLLFLNRALEQLLGLGIGRVQAHARDLSEEIAEGLGHAGICTTAAATWRGCWQPWTRLAEWLSRSPGGFCAPAVEGS